MPTYTPSNNIKKIGTGDESGTWGDSTNNNFDIIDRASNGFYTLDIQTLDTTGSGTVGSSGRPYVLPLSASALLSIGHYKAIRLTSSGVLTADTHLKLEGDNNARVYMMQNDTTANAGINVVVFQGTFSASRSAEVARYQFAILFADGSGASTSYVRHVTEDISPLTKPLTIIDGTADASAPQLTVESTNTTGLSGPFINLERNPSEAGATDDFLGGVLFTGYNDAGTPEKIIYGSVLGKIKSPTDGAEDGELNFYMGSGGSTLSFLELGHASAQAEVVVNTAGADVDFRVEGDTLPNLFGTEASTDKVLAGTGAARISGPSSHLVQVEGDSSHPAGISVTQSQTSTAGPLLTLAKSKNGTIGSSSNSTKVVNNDVLGTISFAGDDGIDLANVAAEIKTVVDGTPASNDIPGAIEFSTTAENESTPTRRLKIFNDGAIGVGTTGSSAAGGASTYSLISLGGNSPPQWLPAPTGRQFIHSVIISDVDYVKFGFPDDTHLSSPFTGNLMFDHNTYHAYEFELVTVVPVTDSVTINAEVYILGSGYDTTANYKLGAGNQSSFRLNGGAAVGNDANEGLTQCYTLYNAHSVSSGGGVIKPLIPSNGRYHSATAIGNASQTIMSYGNGDVSITGIRFGASSGNLSTGRITMYGIRRSFNV